MFAEIGELLQIEPPKLFKRLEIANPDLRVMNSVIQSTREQDCSSLAVNKNISRTFPSSNWLRY